jgi:hypothetical protein
MQLKYSFSERSRTFILEQVRQRLERSDGSLDDERRVFHAFLNIEEIMRHRHMLQVLQLDDLSDDLIPNKVTQLLVLPFRENSHPAHGNAIFSPILLHACINDFPDVVRTILRSGVISTNHFLTFQMLIDLFRNRIGVYRRFYRREQKEIERRRQSILTSFARHKQSTGMKLNAPERPVSLAGTTQDAAAGDAQLGVIRESCIMEETGIKSLFVSSPDPDLDYACNELTDELMEFEAEVIDSIIDKLTVTNLYSISDLYKEMKSIHRQKSVVADSDKCVPLMFHYS